nr:Tetracycline repressor protein class D [Paraburkholderia busanensis]
MVKKSRGTQRREESLSRDQIIEASIALLDNGGESGLTFRALSERLATGAGAIYWYVDNKSDLLTAACDAVIAGTVDATSNAATLDASPKAAIRALALGMFDAIDAHPWVGAALTRAPGQLPTVRIFECIGQQVRALGVPKKAEWGAVSALLSYILGVSGQNAANAHVARELDADRTRFLDEVATMWSELDANEFPFTRSVAGRLRSHDDRGDFLTGIDLILAGIETTHGR